MFPYPGNFIKFFELTDLDIKWHSEVYPGVRDYHIIISVENL